MSDIFDVWINKGYLPEEDKKKFYSGNIDRCIKIQMYKICPLCNKERAIYKNYTGSKDEETSFDYLCSHSGSYQDIYKHRVQSVGSIIVGSVTSTVIKDPLNDGMKCSGTCGSWVPMASANQADGSFICYGCRSRF